MRTAVLIALCISIVCSGCSQSGSGGAAGGPESWVEIARFEGDADIWTKTFTVTPSRFRVSWETTPPASGAGLFILDVRKAGDADQPYDSIVGEGGPATGSQIVEKNGKFYFKIEAKQPWTVWVEVPD